MAEQFLDVPDRIELRQLPGKQLVGRTEDGTLLPVLVDASGVLIVVTGPGNDYSGMTERFILVPDRGDLKQVGGSLLVGREENSPVNLPVAVDANGRLIISGGGSGPIGGVWRYWEASHDDDNPPPDPTIAVERRFLDGDSPLVWVPPSGPWV